MKYIRQIVKKDSVLGTGTFRRCTMENSPHNHSGDEPDFTSVHKRTVSVRFATSSTRITW